MKRPRSLVIVMLGLACLVVIACQTAGTPPQSQAAGQSGTSAQAGTQSQASSQAAAQRQTSAADTGRSDGTARRSGNRAPAVSARFKALGGGAAQLLGKLYNSVTGQKMRSTTAIEWAAVAAIIIAIGAIAIVLSRRHRKLAPSSLKARR